MVITDSKKTMSYTITTNHPQTNTESMKITIAYTYKYFMIWEDNIATVNISQK